MTENILNDPQSLDTPIRPTWCPGCGNFSIWLALKKSIASLQIPLEQLVVVYDVGCSGNMADFNRVYAFHSLHGRAVPPSVGIKLANHDLKVIVIIGDGGGYGEGLTHFVNEMRGNHDVTILVHNNHRYSLTTGQMSPTTDKGTKTKSTPDGSIESPINPIAISLVNHATYVARGLATDVPHLTNLVVNGVNHTGFSVIDVLQPCMVFNPEMDARWYMQNTVKLDAEGHEPTDKSNALNQALREDKLPIGLFWQDTQKRAYHQEDITLKVGPLVKQNLSQINIDPLLEEFK